jgi:hypothetical protein
MNTNDFLTKTGNYLRKITLKAELLYLILLIIAFILKVLLISQASLIAILIFLAVGINYFFCAFSNNYEEGSATLDRFFIKLFELSSSVTCIGLLFRIQNWPGNMSFLTVGIISILVSFGWIYLRRNREEEPVASENNYVYRIIALLGMALILFLVTSR